MATLETLLSQQMTERLGWTLIHFVWQAAAVALLLAAALRCLRRSSSDVRYIVACLALVLIVVLPLVTMRLVEVSGPVAEAGPILDGPSMTDATPVEVVEVAELPAEPFDARVLEIPDEAVRLSWTQRAAAALEPALPWLVFGWLLGVFGLSAWHLGGWAQLQRMKRRMVCEVAAPLRARLADLSNRLGIHRATGLVESALVEVPTVVGWVKPVILLPASAVSGLGTEQIEAILAHELAHIRRCDYLVNLAQTVVEILGFYHPAVWWVSHRIRDERENCCDDLAVQVCGDSRRYARALTCLEELRHRGTELAVAASGGSLITRIARLLGQPPVDDRRFTWLPGLIALLLVAAILIPTALVLAAPDAPLAMEHVDSQFNKSEPAADVTVIQAATQALADEQQQDQPKVLVNFLLFTRAMPDRMVDTETRLLIGEILAPEIPQALDETTGVGSKQDATVAEILRTWVAGRLLTRETMELLIDVLQSHGYLDGEATPELLTNNDQQAQMNIITQRLSLPAADSASLPKPIELGTFMQVTPHVPSPTSDRITLEIGVEWRWQVEQAPATDTPTIRTTEIASTVTVLTDHYFTLLARPDNTENAPGTDSEFLLVVFRANHFESDAPLQNASAPQTQPTDKQSRQIVLDVRTVTLARSDLTDLGVEWGRPQTSSAVPGQWPSGIEMGYTPDKTFTNSLLTRLNELCEQGRANWIAGQQMTTLDGREARFKATTEEWYAIPPAPTEGASEPRSELASIASGVIISATPTIGDSDAITLEMAVEFGEGLPRSTGPDLPVVTRRTARNVATVQDGGTVILAGMSPARADSAQDITILVTAGIAREDEQLVRTASTTPLVPPPAEPPAVRIPASSGSEPTLSEPSAGNHGSGERRITTEQLADTRREYVNADPMVRELAKKIAEIEVDLVAAQQKFLPQHPEIVRKKQLQEAFKNRLEERRKELEQRLDAGIISVAVPDAPEKQRANGEKAYEILRKEMTRIEQRLAQARSARYPDETEQSRELERLTQYKEVLEQHSEEFARLLGEQPVPADKPETAQLSETDRSAARMKHLGMALRLYAESHDGRYPDDLLPLDPYLSVEDSRWIETSVVYVGKGRTVNDEPNTPIAYDKGLLEKTGCTPIRFTDGQIRLVSARALTQHGEQENAVQVEARFVLVDRACMEAMQRGLPIKGITTAADVNALHEIGASLSDSDRAKVLEPNQIDLLLKAIRRYTDSKTLAAPRITVLDGEPATMSLSDRLDYISGYREPNDASQEPIPQHESKDVGVTFDVTPRLVGDHNDIRLRFKMEITSLLGMQKALYRDKYEYDIPSIETVAVDTVIVVPDGQTALIRAGQARSFGKAQPNEEDEPARPLLILIKPRKTTASPPDPMSPMIPGLGPGDGGMGEFRPGGAPIEGVPSLGPR